MGVSGRQRREWHLKGWLGSEKNHAIAFYSIPLECRLEQANKQDHSCYRSCPGPFSEPITLLPTGVCTGYSRLSTASHLGIIVVAKLFHLESYLGQTTACQGLWEDVASAPLSSMSCFKPSEAKAWSSPNLFPPILCYSCPLYFSKT